MQFVHVQVPLQPVEQQTDGKFWKLGMETLSQTTKGVQLTIRGVFGRA